MGVSFRWYLLIFANGVRRVQKCGYGWWLWLSKPWIIIKWSTFVWMLWLPQAFRPKSDILNFGPCQKKHDGKYCGFQSYLGLQKIEKIVLVACIIKTSIKKTIFYCCSHYVLSNRKYYWSSHWFDYRTFMLRTP